MKHDLNITLLLIVLFLSSHIIGLFVINHYLPEKQNLPLNIEKPKFEEKTAYIPLIITILIATGLALILLKFKAFRLWKVWFFLSVFITLSIAFSAFIIEKIAVLIALILAIFKTFKPNIYIHNLTEVFIYGGLAAIFVPVLGLFSIIILLLLISIYDMIAVWKTKHMISLAKFQSESNIFAGLLIPYGKRAKSLNVERNVSKKINIQVKQAILGGGDIGFPLMFSGVILKLYGYAPALLVSLFAAVSLFILFAFAEKKKFYPAMPFITIGCLLGLLAVKLIF